MKYTPEQRKKFSEMATGKRITSMHFATIDDCWVIHFADSSFISVKMMAELHRKYTPLMRKGISDNCKDKVIARMYYDDAGEGGGYWIMQFDDESEMCVRLVAEL
jgi:hypothetical protein